MEPPPYYSRLNSRAGGSDSARWSTRTLKSASRRVWLLTALLDQIDPMRRLSDVTVLAGLLGAGYGAWRTRADHEASPDSMSMIIQGRDRVLVPVEPLRFSRAGLAGRRNALAGDLAVLLRRAATEHSGP